MFNSNNTNAQLNNDQRGPSEDDLSDCFGGGGGVSDLIGAQHNDALDKLSRSTGNNGSPNNGGGPVDAQMVRNRGHRRPHIQETGMFMMDIDGHETGAGELDAFHNSDSSSDTEDDPDSPPAMMPHHRPLHKQYAVSLPISVRWMQSSQHHNTKEQEDQENQPHQAIQNIEQLAESFRQCQTKSFIDGTELFGDLPRPRTRLHTADIVRQRSQLPRQ